MAGIVAFGIAAAVLSIVLLWKRGVKWLALGALALLAFVLLQAPWRPLMAGHIVKEWKFAEHHFAILQQHSGGGLHSTFLAVRKDQGRWEWYLLGSDNLYWRNIVITPVLSNRFTVKKYGVLLGSFDVTKRELTDSYGNIVVDWSKVSWEVP